jgi:hypothetical protein
MQLKIVAQNSKKLFATRCALLPLTSQIGVLQRFVLFSHVFRDVPAEHIVRVDFDYADTTADAIASILKIHVVSVHSFHDVVIFILCVQHPRHIDANISTLPHALFWLQNDALLDFFQKGRFKINPIFHFLLALSPRTYGIVLAQFTILFDARNVKPHRVRKVLLEKQLFL